MRRLILMRHAKAVRPEEAADDFARGLDARGRLEAPRAARLLADLCPTPDIALVSGAARTMETWSLVSPVFAAREALIEDELYLASGDALIARLEPLRDADTVFVIGHNPGLKECAGDLLGDGPHDVRARERLHEGLPTSCALVLGLDGFAARGAARIAAFVTPGRNNDDVEA